VHILAFDDVGTGENRVAFRVAGNGRPMVQITAEYYLPWDEVPPEPVGQEPLSVEVSYDRTALAVQDEVTVTVWLNLNAPGTAQMVLLDLGVPPGFTVLDEDLQALVVQGLIERFELTGRQIIVYLTDLPSGQPLTFQYGLQARIPLRVQIPASLVYDYYSPDRRGEERPLLITVEDGESEELGD
jgi:molecular chaperone DnaK (HSP70)